MEEDVSRLRLCTLRSSLGYRMESDDVETSNGSTPKGRHDMSFWGNVSLADYERLQVKLKAANVLLRDILFAEWHGSGPEDRAEFYCPWCEAHDKDSEKIPHEPHCGFYKIRKYLDDVKKERKVRDE